MAGIDLCRVDITKAAECVCRSRKIFQAFNEAKEFEENFLKVQSKIPKTYFVRTNLSITTAIKAMIFTVHYIKNRETAAKSIKQSLKKNCSFKAFKEDLTKALTSLRDLGLLTTELRENVRKRDLNGNVVLRTESFFK